MNGAKIIIIPSYWLMTDCSSAGFIHNPLSEKIFIDSAITSRAFENTCAVIYVNAGGPPSMGYAGQSQVSIPFMGPIGKMKGSEEGMIIVDLDTAIVDEAEGAYKIRADLAREDWHYHYRHKHH